GTAVGLARAAGLSEWAIGVTVVAAGTSVPELATSVVAARRGEVAIAAGNVVGSNVFNLPGVLGVAAAIHPLSVAADLRPGLAALVVLTAVATALLATGRRLTRPEGGALVLVAVAYWLFDALYG
ncbi:sodium:calcium antiporter, partial [Saliphagus infecundisoli]